MNSGTDIQRKCNFLLGNVIELGLSLNPDFGYIQNLWDLGIIDEKEYREGPEVVDRFSEESYDTVVRILPNIIDLINNKFPENCQVTDRIRRANIFTCLEELNLAQKTSDFKLVLKK